MTAPNRKPLLKLILIPVLLAVLGLRLVEMTGSPELPASEKTAGRTPATDGEIKLASNPEPDPAHLNNWPMRSLSEILEHDPFSKPQKQHPDITNLAEASGDEATPVKFEPQSIDLKMIYRSGGAVVALVGSRIVKAGDHLDDGSLVVSIGEQEIIVQPSSQKK